MIKRIDVDADALFQVLRALNGPDHYIRELQVIRGIPKELRGHSNPIDTLVEEYNEWVGRQKNEIRRPYGACSITGSKEDVAFIMRHLPDVDEAAPSYSDNYDETNQELLAKALYCNEHGDSESVENWLQVLRERLQAGVLYDWPKWRSPEQKPVGISPEHSVTVLGIIDDAHARGDDDKPYIEIVSYWPKTDKWTATMIVDDDADDKEVSVKGWIYLPPNPYLQPAADEDNE